MSDIKIDVYFGAFGDLVIVGRADSEQIIHSPFTNDVSGSKKQLMQDQPYFEKTFETFADLDSYMTSDMPGMPAHVDGQWNRRNYQGTYDRDVPKGVISPKSKVENWCSTQVEKRLHQFDEGIHEWFKGETDE